MNDSHHCDVSGESFVWLVLAVFPAGCLAWGLATGTIIGPGSWRLKRAKEPWYFWLSVAFNAAWAGACIYQVVNTY
jgi:hypothetical protein